MGTAIRLQSQCGSDPVLGVSRITFGSLIDREDLQNSESHTQDLIYYKRIQSKTSKGNRAHAVNSEGNQAQVPENPLPVRSRQDTIPPAPGCDSTCEIMSTTKAHLGAQCPEFFLGAG